MKHNKTFQELEFKDAFMFAASMEDPELCQAVLERILGISIKKVVVHAEHEILLNPDYRGVRLDVYANDENGTVYDVEMQTVDHKNIPKRSRMYQSQMDVKFLEPGKDFNELPESLVIFICTFDPCGRGRYRYTFRERCEEDGELLEDGTCKIFLNTKGRNPEEVPEELVRFLEYVETPWKFGEDTSDPVISHVRGHIAKLKKDRRLGERYMTIQDLLNQEREEGRKEGSIETDLATQELFAVISFDDMQHLKENPSILKELKQKYNIASKTI